MDEFEGARGHERRVSAMRTIAMDPSKVAGSMTAASRGAKAASQLARAT